MSPADVDSFETALRREVDALVAARFPAQRALNRDLLAVALDAVGDPEATHLTPVVAGDVAVAVVSRVEEWGRQPEETELANLSVKELVSLLVGRRRG